MILNTQINRLRTIIESAILNDSYILYDGDCVKYRTFNKINLGDVVYIFKIDTYAVCVDINDNDLTFIKIDNNNNDILIFKY